MTDAERASLDALARDPGPVPMIAGRVQEASLDEIAAWVRHPYSAFNPVVRAVLERLLAALASTPAAAPTESK